MLEAAAQPMAVRPRSVRWATTERPARAAARSAPDTVGAVAAGDAIVVAPFERRWEFPAESTAGTRVVAQWVDGRPAVIEWRHDSGCERSSVVPRDTVGDLILRPDFARFERALAAPCGVARQGTVPGHVLALLAGPPDATPAVAIPPREQRASPIAPWLLALALVLAAVEMLARRRGRRA